MFTNLGKMAHIPYQTLRGITLPGDKAIVTGRVHNWLSELSDDIAPVSCWVLSLQEPVKYSAVDLCDFFVLIAKKLQEGAGINVCLDSVYQSLTEIQVLNLKPKVKFSKIPFEHNNPLQVVKVADSLQLNSTKSMQKFPDHVSIFDSWRLAWLDVIEGKETLFDYSAVREADEISTGRESFIKIVVKIISLFEKPTLENFLQILSEINGTIKRGGLLKLGAVTTSMKWNDPLIVEYLSIPFANLPHVKKSVSLSAVSNFPKSANIINDVNYDSLPYDLLQMIVGKYDDGEIFIEKYLGTSQGKELRSNVCRGITLLPQDQCLISNINLGMMQTLSQIVDTYKEVATFLCDVWRLQEELGFQLIDRQIAISPVGLANCLRNFNITYQEFIDAQFHWLYHKEYGQEDLGLDTFALTIGINEIPSNVRALLLIEAVHEGMVQANEIASKLQMRAVHTVEPTESCARRYKDINGFDVVPNINPPNVMPGVGIEHRHSQVGVKDEQGRDIGLVFNYGQDIQTMSQVTTEDIFHLWDNWQRMMECAGLAHMVCYENWGDFSIRKFYKWLDSNLKTLYYQQKITNTSHLDKGNNIASARARYNEALACKTDDPDYCASCSD